MIGGVYAVISIGLTLVFGVMGIVNFAQAEFLMLGMFVAYYAWAWFWYRSAPGALPIAFAVVFALGAAVQRTLIRRVLKAPEVAQIFLTVGLLIVLENASLCVRLDFKSVTTPYQTSRSGSGRSLSAFPTVAFLMSVACGVALWWFMRTSWFGRAMRATAQDPMAARLMGINTEDAQLAFALGVGLTAFGGAVILPYRHGIRRRSAASSSC